ncbi:helix-turn-helix domain-containing protein [Clostridiaceae bacterium UIB06]|uniref:Helix-turn-helix domain-containing protein n=1 Tax=Clostridium thailandense TaxID=2794346 RepID=A0A949TWE7_9CLOT|nr:helix-turn-helix domain-containing protein [Clostridium thailandense]MBV7271619.1 helix-turn-helix domain-containing protein [Clostridium thailandense]MCH5136411.1 helix-turn-helix domain-containing protein [Clostridiaceae bacterium UIB06]
MEAYLYTVEEVAAILKVNKNAVYDLIRNGLLTALKLGRLKVTKPTLLSFLREYNGKDLSDLEHIKELTFQNETSTY